MTAHIGADFDLGSRRRRKVKMGIEAGDRMDLADRNVHANGKLLQLICRQVAKLLLDRPELIEQGASVPVNPV